MRRRRTRCAATTGRYAARSGWSRSDDHSVGGPGAPRSPAPRSMVRSASPGSKVATGSAVAPVMRQSIHPALYPKQWKNGGTMRSRSPSRKPKCVPQLSKARRLCACVSSTPLGRPVVPDVNMMSATSSPSIASIRAIAASSSTASPPARNARERLGVSSRITRQHHHAAGRGELGVGVGEQLDVVDPEEAVDGEQHASAALPQHVRGFVAFEPRVDRYRATRRRRGCRARRRRTRGCSVPRWQPGRRLRHRPPSPHASRPPPARRAPRRSRRRSPSTTASRSENRGAFVRRIPGIDPYRSSALTSCPGECGDDRRDRIEVLRVEPGVELDVAEAVLAP